MVYVTGDIHGDITRLKSRILRKLKKNDYLIVCGDFGFLWDGSAREKRILKWIGKRRYHVLFVEGSHDNYTLLNQYPKKDWHGGEVHEISGRLLHLCRGWVFDIDGHSVFAFGGGQSDDANVRVHTSNWWGEELPSEEEIARARRNLTQAGNTVDFIVTHQPSRKIKMMLSPNNDEATVLDIFLDEVRASCRYIKWYFGNLHTNMLIPPCETALFNAFTPMEENGTLIGARKKWKMR